MRRLVLALALLLGSAAAHAATPGDVAVLFGGCRPIALPSGNKVAQPYFASGWTPTGLASQPLSTGLGCAYNAMSFVEDTSTGSHGVDAEQVFTVSAVQYTNSLYARSTSGRNVNLAVFDPSFGSNALGYFNPTSCTVAGTAGSFGSISAAAQAIRGGWCKLSLSFTAISTTGLYTYVSASTGGTTTSYTGDGASSITVWGECLQAGSTC